MPPAVRGSGAAPLAAVALVVVCLAPSAIAGGGQPTAPDRSVAEALGRLVQFAEGLTLTPGEWRSLAAAVEREWTSDPSQHGDLLALPRAVRLVQETPEPERPALRDALAQRLREVAQTGDHSPLGSWVSDLLSDEPVRLPSGVEAGSRHVRGVLEAAAMLIALDLGRDQATLDPAPTPDDLAAALTDWTGSHPEQAQLWQRGDELAAFVERQVAVRDLRPNAMRLAGMAQSMNVPPKPPGEIGAGAPSSAVDLAPVELPRSGLTFLVPADWHAPDPDPKTKAAPGLSVLVGPQGAADGPGLRNAIRVFGGAAPPELHDGRVSVQDWARKQLGVGDWRPALPSPSGGPVILAGYREQDGVPVLVLYAADVGGGHLVAARGEWPVAQYNPIACVGFFLRLWGMKDGADLPPLAVSPDDARSAATALLASGAAVGLLPERAPEAWFAAP